MDHSNVTITLPMTGHGLGVILTALGIGVGSWIIWLVLSEKTQRTERTPLALLTAFGWFLLPFWLLLFAGTLWQVWLMLSGVPSVLTGQTPLGTGALLAALLGAPFLVWGTVLKQRTVDFQKEGHITDRINKAVEQLGAEKSVDQIGRPVTVWTGKPRQSSCSEEIKKNYLKEPRSKVTGSAWSQSYHEETDEVWEGVLYEISIWPHEKTIIQWQDEELEKQDHEEIGSIGQWQPFTKTMPNIEVRIGALLSLERIAQDSTNYDKGRDHVRVMEILCAYVRENTATPSLEPETDEYGPFTPRTDIQISIDVIKRRRKEQIEIEAGQEYRLDLRRCDFRGVDLSLGSFRGAILSQSRFEFAFMRGSDFSGARFDGSVLNHLNCTDTKFIGADMRHCRIDRPEPRPGGFISTINMGDLTGLSLISASIPSVQYLGKENGFTFGTNDTFLDWELDEQRKEGVKIGQDINRIKDGTCSDEVAKLQERLSGNPFVNWSPYDGSDMTTGHSLRKFRKSLSLIGWPYDH